MIFERPDVLIGWLQVHPRRANPLRDGVTDSHAMNELPLYTLQADLRRLSESRQRVLEWLDTIAWVSRSQRDDIALVSVELITNAIEASGPDDTISYGASENDAGISLQVMNNNRVGSAVQLQSMPDPAATSGRGLALAQTFADRVDVVSAGSHVHIRAFFGRPSG